MTTIQPKHLDVRVRARKLQGPKPDLDPKELEAYLAALPDLSEACEPVSLEQPALVGDLDDED